MRRPGLRAALGAVAMVAGLVVMASPVAAVGDEVVGLGVGDYVGCAVKSDRTLWCWGLNESHQVGDGSDGTDDDRFTPVQVQRSAAGPLTGIVDVSPSGYDHMCALKSDRTVRCWGDNSSGQLGDGTTDERFYPVSMMGSPKLGEATAFHSFRLAAGQDHTCGLRPNATVLCWGANSRGQLGDGTTDPHPAAVPVKSGTGLLGNVVSVAAGYRHTCALRAGGTMLCWGDNGDGQLAIGSADPDPHPVPVLVRKADGTPLKNIVAIDAGAGHTCALMKDASVRCWGRNTHGQVGDASKNPRFRPVKVKRGAGFLANVVSLSVGANHTCAVTADGKAWCWGDNANGEGGIGEAPDEILKATRVTLASASFTNVRQVRAGDSVSCFLKANRTAWCTGYSEYGAIGSGTTEPYTHHPERVAFP